MTTTAATWFYHPPEKSAFLIAERVRTSLWDQRLGAVWLETERTENPVRLTGQMEDSAISLEWEPAQWLRLGTQPEAPALAHGVSYLLQRQPTLKYTDPAGNSVWEWWIQPAAAEQRWQAMQGQPSFGSPVRLKR